jgi:hypothetical protein
LQYRVASSGARRDCNNRILAFRYCDFRGTFGGPLVDAMIERQAGALLPLLHPGFAFLVQ